MHLTLKHTVHQLDDIATKHKSEMIVTKDNGDLVGIIGYRYTYGGANFSSLKNLQLVVFELDKSELDVTSITVETNSKTFATTLLNMGKVDEGKLTNGVRNLLDDRGIKIKAVRLA